jgi:hypothetical protein
VFVVSRLGADAGDHWLHLLPPAAELLVPRIPSLKIGG